MKNVPYFVIAGLVVVLIIFVMKDCQRPSEEKEAEIKKLYDIQAAILTAEKIEAQAAQDSIGKVLIQTTRKDSLAIKRQESVIQALERKAARQRVDVDTIIRNSPALMAFVSTQQEVINELKVEVDTLKSQAQFQRKLNEDLIFNEMVEDKVEQEMALQSSRRIADLEKSLKKRERKSKLKTILLPVVGVVALILGTQL